MSDKSEAVLDVAKELGRVVAKTTVQTAAEVVAATLVLAAAGTVWNKIEQRRAKKNLAVVSE